MTSATSDSTAAPTSPVDTRSWRTTRSRRSRDSASAGNASSASNAAVRRRPWPSLWRRWTPAGLWFWVLIGVTVAGWLMAVGWGAVGQDTRVIGTDGRLIEPKPDCWGFGA